MQTLLSRTHTHSANSFPHIWTGSDPHSVFFICFVLIIADGGDDDDDDDGEDGDETPSKAPHPMSSSALMKLAEGGEDVVEDLELSDDDWGSDGKKNVAARLRVALHWTHHLIFARNIGLFSVFFAF